MNPEIIRDKFYYLFNKEPLLVRSPGRINLIGEHTDYNEGYVLPAAIDKSIIFGIALRDDRRCRLHAVDLNENYLFNIDDLQKSKQVWPNYLLGVVDQLKKNGYPLRGFDCAFGGDIPIGAGLSSSAALECGLAFALNQLLELEIDTLDLVKMARKAEHKYAGVRCGIMDQFASMFGKAERVIQLDCRSLNYRYYPLDLSEYKIILCDTKVKHSLADSEYNTRRKECMQGVSILKRSYQNISSLRDVSLKMLDARRRDFPTLIYRRCKYILQENRRVTEACQDLLEDNLTAFGEKMYHSHAGLRDDYDVSCKELDFLVDETLSDPNVIGARMMGGGFGGCTINLVKADAVDTLQNHLTQAYEKTFGGKPGIYNIRISQGTEVAHI